MPINPRAERPTTSSDKKIFISLGARIQDSGVIRCITGILFCDKTEDVGGAANLRRGFYGPFRTETLAIY
jgi:hypothetical protein